MRVIFRKAFDVCWPVHSTRLKISQIIAKTFDFKAPLSSSRSAVFDRHFSVLCSKRSRACEIAGVHSDGTVTSCSRCSKMTGVFEKAKRVPKFCWKGEQGWLFKILECQKNYLHLKCEDRNDFCLFEGRSYLEILNKYRHCTWFRISQKGAHYSGPFRAEVRRFVWKWLKFWTLMPQTFFSNLASEDWNELRTLKTF